TLNAIRAMAHLGGIGGARKYIETGGAYDPADSNGTNLSDYAATHGGTYTGASTQPFTPTMLREADGSLTSRMYSPGSGEILQAHRAAAGIAYQSEVLVKGQADLMGLSEQFLLDPDGFGQAARGYVDDLVKSAPDEFRAELRQTLDTEVQRRSLGILEDRHRDIRQRAENASSALADNQVGQLAAAIAGGDPRDIAAARTQLQSTLYARESLPGVAWTPEQSANTMREAEDAGRKAIQDRTDKARTKAKGTFDTISKARAEGRRAADEALLDQPGARDLDPEGYDKAASWVALTDALPNLFAGTPAQVASAASEFLGQAVTDDYQIALGKVVQEGAAKHAKAFDEDPIAAAMTYLPEKPAPLPAFDPANPQPFMDGLAKRAVDAQALVDDGYTRQKVMVTQAERKELSAAFGAEVPYEVKAGMATAVAATLGGDAATFFRNIGADDPILLHLGQLAAMGGSEAVTLEGFKGAELLRTGQARKPTNAASIAEISPEVATALAGVPDDVIKISDQVFQSAIAVAAARSPQTAEPGSEEAKKVMQDALQSVLGQSADMNGNLTGGVQTIASAPALLPAGMRGRDLNDALEAAFTPDRSDYSAMEQLAMITGYERPGLASTGVWPDGGPVLEGQPLKPYHFDMAVITPAGGNTYRLSLNINGQIVDARNAAGQAYTFDAQALVDAWRAKQ
ncbi:MAG: hypothetical protein ACRC14_02945, partial [Paracoccaceae bacterium]